MNLPFINLNGDFTFGKVILGIPMFGICMLGVSTFGGVTFTDPVKLPVTFPSLPTDADAEPDASTFGGVTFGKSTVGIFGTFMFGTSGIRLDIFNSNPNSIELPSIEKSNIAVPSSIKSNLPASIFDISST